MFIIPLEGSDLFLRLVFRLAGVAELFGAVPFVVIIEGREVGYVFLFHLPFLVDDYHDAHDYYKGLMIWVPKRTTGSMIPRTMPTVLLVDSAGCYGVEGSVVVLLVVLSVVLVLFDVLLSIGVTGSG